MSSLRSPIELFWTAKNLGKTSFAIHNRYLFEETRVHSCIAYHEVENSQTYNQRRQTIVCNKWSFHVCHQINLESEICFNSKTWTGCLFSPAPLLQNRCVVIIKQLKLVESFFREMLSHLLKLLNLLHDQWSMVIYL